MANSDRLVDELLFPLRELGVLVTLLVFAFLLFVSGLLGEILAMVLGADPVLFAFVGQLLVALPAIVRFLLGYLEARMRGVSPPTLSFAHFSWFTRPWSLWPIVPLALTNAVLVLLLASGQTALAWGVAALVVAIMPAMLAILTITHSVLESLNPFAITRLVVRARDTYWIAPSVAIVTAFLIALLGDLPALVYEIAVILLCLLTAGITGWALRPFALFDEVYVHEDHTAAELKRRNFDDRQREAVLGHAYGFASRDNVEGALGHITNAIGADRGEHDAWQWYFEQMLKWENSFPAMKFAQLYITYLLSVGEQTQVIKLVMRCRMIDERFKPASENIPEVVALLERYDQPELARAIRR